MLITKAEKSKSLKSSILILMIVLSVFTALISSIGTVSATTETYNFNTIEYTVPNICTEKVVDLKATFESGNPYKIRIQGTIQFSASAWTADPRGVMVNVGLVASRSQQVTNPSYSAMRNGGDVPSDHLLYVTSDQLFKNFWYASTGRSASLGTMWTEIHPDAQGCELATTWAFSSSGGNQQQKIFDYTIQFSDVSMTRMFLLVGIMDWHDFVSGILQKLLTDGLMILFTKCLPVPEGTAETIRLIEAIADVIDTTSSQDRGNIDAFWLIPIGESVDAEELDWVAGGNDLPQRTTYGGESVHGGDAIRLGDFEFKDLKNNEQAWISATVTGPGTISFYWKVSSESYWDYLRFYIDDVQQAAISGSVDWQFKSFSVGSGSHTLKWAYTKDGSVSAGSDCGWVDWIAWIPGYLAGGLKGKYYNNKDFTDYMLSRVDSTVNFDWGSGTPDSRVGSDTFSVSWTGKIRIDSYNTYTFYVVTDDGSRLWVNGQLIIDKWYDQSATEHSGSITLSSGYYDIRYEYYENGGLAVAKLRWSSSSISKQTIPSSNLYYSPAISPTTPISLGEATDNYLSWTTGGNAYWFGQTSTYYIGGDAAQSSAITHNQQTYMQTTATGPGTISFYWKVSSESYWDYLRFYIDDVQQAAISGSVDWQFKSFSVGSGSHTLKWAYTKDGSINTGFDCGWVDYVVWSYSGGGGGCPILYIYDGSEYVCEGLLDIHNPDGVDVVTSHTLVTIPKWVNGAYLLRLVEHPQTHSYIDQVKLYAVLEDKSVVELPLIWAWHSEYGNVLPQLLFSDDWKTDTLGANLNDGTSQNIDLKFAALNPNMNITGFVFQIEGNNIIVKV